MSTQDTNHPTDPTPRTAATARERVTVDYAMVERAIRTALPADMVFAYMPHGDPFAAWAGHLFANLTALAAAEAPGRVAELEAALRRIADLDPDLDAEAEAAALASAKRIASNALAAPASPAGVSGKVCAVCKDVRLGVQHDRYSMSAWHPFRAAPAPTPSEPVGRLAVPVLCNLAGHPSRLHHHDRDGKVRMVPTPATRDE